MKVAMPFDLDHALRYLIAAEGSDLHLKVPAYPLVRLHGKLEPIAGAERLTPQDTERVLREMLHDPDKLGRVRGRERGRLLLRARGPRALPRQRLPPAGFVSLVLRAIPVNIKSIEELSLPPVIRRLAEEERGIILLTGTTGSGKSTTLAAMIDHMNRTMHKHIVTIEDPIEFLHPDRNSIVNQREVGQDTASPSSARCGACCARTRTSSSSARCATRRRSRPRSPPRRPATSCSRRCTPSTRPSRSTASSTSSRRTSSRRRAR